MVLMAVMGVLLLVGIALAVRWNGTAYEAWDREADGGPPSVKAAALRYLRGVAVALVGGFWAGALVTGPAVRLIMRLLAATAGDDAQGVITEAKEVVGEIDLGGTLGLYVFGGILPGLASGALYVVFRRWLPGGRLAGVAFGLLHLVLGATRLDPLRPGNPDFDIVGPGWLSVLTFSLASILHGMAVVAIANRYSRRFPPKEATRATRVRAVLPLLLPALMLVPAVFFVMLIVVGLAITLVATRVRPLVAAMRSRTALLAGRIALAALALVLLPYTTVDLRDVVVRDSPAAAADGAAGR